MSTEKSSDQIRRIEFVLQKYQRSRASVYRDIAHGDFPRPVRLGSNAIGWFDSQLAAHDEALKAAAAA